MRLTAWHVQMALLAAVAVAANVYATLYWFGPTWLIFLAYFCTYLTLKTIWRRGGQDGRNAR